MMGGGAAAGGSVSRETPTYGATTPSGGVSTEGAPPFQPPTTGTPTFGGGAPVDLVPSLLKPFAGIREALPWNVASVLDPVRSSAMTIFSRWQKANADLRLYSF